MRMLGGLLVMLVLAVSGRALAADFEVEYRVRLLPGEGLAKVSLHYRPGEGRIRELDFRMDPERYDEIRGDGRLQREDERLSWRPPAEGGVLHWSYRINRQRRDDGYDARITRDWALLRGDHLVPSFRGRFSSGAEGRARLRFELPEGWGVDTPFKRLGEAPVFEVAHDDRRLARPVGWLIAGDLGIRREFIEGMEVAVAAPKGEPVRRNEMLAFINLVAPEMQMAFGTLPEKILIVLAGEGMWRGGLSGPRSLYLHSERPIISENGTSTLVHELVHVVTRISGAEGDDWITEGLAEFYSVELLRRTGLLSELRAERAFEWLQRHGRDVRTLKANRSHGPRTARAVTLFRALDAEIRSRTDQVRSLDDVVRELIPLRRVSTAQLREVVERLSGAPSKVLQTALL